MICGWGIPEKGSGRANITVHPRFDFRWCCNPVKKTGISGLFLNAASRRPVGPEHCFERPDMFLISTHQERHSGTKAAIPASRLPARQCGHTDGRGFTVAVAGDPGS